MPCKTNASACWLFALQTEHNRSWCLDDRFRPDVSLLHRCKALWKHKCPLSAYCYQQSYYGNEYSGQSSETQMRISDCVVQLRFSALFKHGLPYSSGAPWFPPCHLYSNWFPVGNNLFGSDLLSFREDMTASSQCIMFWHFITACRTYVLIHPDSSPDWNLCIS